MKPFAYVKAANEQQALAALGRERGKVMPLAGGMDLVSLLKDRIATPDRLVNVKGLDATIAATPDGGLRIGAAVRLVDLQAHGAVTSQYGALMQAAAEVGTPQIRNLGTVGGNLMQRPRCWYFRNEDFPCLKKGGARCYSVDGENQFHAILGGGPCHIVHPSSLAVPLVAFGAKLRIAGPRGEKEVLAEEFFELPERNLFGETSLRPDELLTHVILPAAKAIKSATYEVRFRSSHDWPIAFASVALQLQGTTVSDARVVLGAVAPIPWRSPEAEAVLKGQTLNEATAAKAADAALAAATPMTQNAYKVQVAKTAVKRALLHAAGVTA
ncbi:4-hydroxybenzoyl-CoA reductase subunit beta [Luteitalea pratensis]|uniref:4-hydroxybenzoyl-CoA reductase subunit beta n=1 Tax=Luteitalea pratensis TaxID=1855912 RepID=A0A143PYS5_LUTPR|nr:xanthine dehydrogenase family protein subunit M [Luteitalea pratensis]AMY12929.1 4-hydroxybenzoyl-CoA reductase subunit beta [Luteitalea pratensis]